MALSSGAVGKTYIVERLSLPLQVEKRMEALGMTLGTKVRILRKKRGGTQVILLRGTRFAVGSGITSNIAVREAEE